MTASLAAFPLWVRLRNDADLRAGLKHIRVADVVRRHLPDPYDTRAQAGTAGHSGRSGDAGSDESGESSQPGTVTATRVYKRPTKSPTGLQGERPGAQNGERDGDRNGERDGSRSGARDDETVPVPTP